MIALKLPSSKHLLSLCPSYCKSWRIYEVPCSTVSLFGGFNYINFNTSSQVLSIDLRASFEISWEGLWNHTVHWVKCFSQLWKGLAPWSNEHLSWFSNGFACTAGNYKVHERLSWKRWYCFCHAIIFCMMWKLANFYSFFLGCFVDHYVGP